MALVTDGCASYAILGYINIQWGISEGARVRLIIITFFNKNIFKEKLNKLMFKFGKFDAFLSFYQMNPMK